MIHGAPLPPSLIEAGNGMVFFLEGFMLLSSGLYFVSLVRVAQGAVTETTTLMQAMQRVYAQAKAAWAASIFFLGLWLRTGDVWWVRHVQNHGGDLGWFAPLAQPIIMLSAIPIVWGGVCWMRAVMPLRFPPQAWIAIFGGAVAFGILMAR